MADGELDFLKSSGNQFGTLGPDAERIRADKGNGHYSVTETYWFEVLIPEANLIAHFYVYMRPNLNMCSAGVWMSRGFCDHPLLMDHYNYQAALPFPRQIGDTICVPEIGLTIKILEPLARLEIMYEPPGSSVRARLSAAAVMPPAVRVTNKHFNQFMRYTGVIALNGETIAVDNVAMRDRSWGEPRLEDPVQAPITTWASGYFADNRTAFNLIGFDDPTHGVEWQGIYDIPAEKTLMDGWYFRDGRFSKVISMSKRSERDTARRMAPGRVEVSFEDADGGRHRLIGEVRAACCVQNWPNIHVWLPLVRWDLDGAIGWGDCQEYLWTDYAQRFWKR